MRNWNPVYNQKFADLVKGKYNDHMFWYGSLVYGVTHFITRYFRELSAKGPCVLITSASDASVTDEMAGKLPANFKFWYSTNVETHNPRIRAIPVGFVFNIERMKILMDFSSKERPPQQNLMYVNFFRAVPRKPNPREGLYELFGGLPWVTCEGGDGIQRLSPVKFYEQIRRHPYVLSPPGAGPDCHRHWESIALGSIPIVLRSRAVDILRDMPCLQVDDWSEVTKDRLIDELPTLQKRFTWDSMEKLDFDFWIKEIRKCLSED